MGKKRHCVYKSKLFMHLVNELTPQTMTIFFPPLKRHQNFYFTSSDILERQ